MNAKITVNGKEHSLLFGYTCYKMFTTGMATYRETFFTANEEITDLGWIHLLHSAYINSCLEGKITPELKFEDIGEWYDEKSKTSEGIAEISALIKVWLETTRVKRLIEDSEKKSQMRNPTGTEQTKFSQGNLVTSPGSYTV